MNLHPNFVTHLTEKMNQNTEMMWDFSIGQAKPRHWSFQ